MKGFLEGVLARRHEEQMSRHPSAIKEARSTYRRPRVPTGPKAPIPREARFGLARAAALAHETTRLRTHWRYLTLPERLALRALVRSLAK